MNSMSYRSLYFHPFIAAEPRHRFARSIWLLAHKVKASGGQGRWIPMRQITECHWLAMSAVTPEADIARVSTACLGRRRLSSIKDPFGRLSPIRSSLHVTKKDLQFPGVTTYAKLIVFCKRLRFPLLVNRRHRAYKIRNCWSIAMAICSAAWKYLPSNR